ncbi:MAG: hypothetical protein US49_C0002G0084 [candidate division TM6 bacterium GW2011_GWF2_37_49]|nr:MAG: hypothetical protein US49_C0002G0084 [candidate division TM6 bacterium GW2011_GWF2_37_49]
MKNFKKLLISVAFLFISSACAMQPNFQASEVAPTEALLATSQEVQKFEDLMQATLNAKRPTILKQISFDTIREIIRLGTVIITLKIADSNMKNGHENNLLLLTAINFLIPLISDLTIRTNNPLNSSSISETDPTLAVLKKLEKYVTTQKLSDENKNQIREQFNKYIDQLSEKFKSESSEKHPNQYLSVQLYRFIIRCLVCLFIGKKYSSAKNNDRMLSPSFSLSLMNVFSCLFLFDNQPTTEKQVSDRADMLKAIKFVSLDSIKEALKEHSTNQG